MPVLCVIAAALYWSGIRHPVAAFGASVVPLLVCALVAWVVYVAGHRSRRTAERVFAATAAFAAFVLVLRVREGEAEDAAAGKQHEEILKTLNATLTAEISRLEEAREKAWSDYELQDRNESSTRSLDPSAIARRIDQARHLEKATNASCTAVDGLPARIGQVVGKLDLAPHEQLAIQAELSNEVYQPLAHICAAELALSRSLIEHLEVVRGVAGVTGGSDTYYDGARLKQAYDQSVDKVNSCVKNLKQVQADEEAKSQERARKRAEREAGEKESKP